MTQKSSHLPPDSYRRIYWYAKRNVDPHVIAHTLSLPLKTIEKLLEKITSAENKSYDPSQKISSQPSQMHIAEDDNDFLDVFVFAKTRHLVLDVSGMLNEKNSGKLSAEVLKLKSSELKAIAIRLTDIKEIDKIGFETIVSIHNDFKHLGRFTAILDPSEIVDTFLQKHGYDKKIPVFGTESAFESKAFR